MNIGIIASSSGGVLSELLRINAQQSNPAHRYFVLTDRPCVAESHARLWQATHQRLVEPDRQAFSRRAADWFARQPDLDFILLFFMRLVTQDLFARWPILNLHPSLLPDFPGRRPLEQARLAQAPYLGATLHRVDAMLDGGPIIAQTRLPWDAGWDEPAIQKRSFLQKVFLSLLAIEWIERKELVFPPQAGIACRDGLPWSVLWPDRLATPHGMAAFDQLQQREGIRIIV